ncbi:SnoaL-like domain-containing protein [Nitrosomonas sp. ANs5]|uniref:SnoaL-like domain-containing protein n=1 Tax=Nitrosomonas sp. ANs5 TaxID=3423941 RepID=UPI003D3263BA
MTLQEKLNDLNRMILKGEILESMDKYYHANCVVIEKNDVVAEGLEQAKKRESEMFEGVEAWLKSEIISTAVGENVTMTEWCFEYKHQDLGHKKFDQVAVQHWQDGKIISDRFYALY